MKVTEIITEAANPAQQAAIAISMKKVGKKPKNESTELEEEFDLIESIINRLAAHNGVDAEVIWEDLETLTEDELYAFAVTSEPIMESYQKGEYGRVLDALGLYYPRISMEELNTPGYYKVIANKADVPVEYAAQVIDGFVNDDRYYDNEDDEEQGMAEGADDKFSVADKVEELVDQYRLYDKRGWTDLFTKLAGRKLEIAEIRREMEYASKFLDLLDSIRMRSDYRGQQDPRLDQELIDLSNQWLSLFNKATSEFKAMSGQGVAEGFNGEYDDEAGMAQSNLLTTARAVMGLLKTIKDRDNLPEWGQEKIAKAEMMLVSVWDYLQSQKAMGNDPQQGVAEGDPYFKSLQTMMERQLEPTMDLDTWVDNFQNADPQKYHQFKNKTPEKKK